MVSQNLYCGRLQNLLQRSNCMTHLLQIHSLLIKAALDHDGNLVAQFVSSMCSYSLDHARSVFDTLTFSPSVYMWNSLIRGYAKSPCPSESVRLFLHFLRANLAPDNFTFPFILKACASASMVREGEMIHCLALKEGRILDSHLGNTLLHMYASCAKIGCAQRVFVEMDERDVVSWSSMIAGYVKCNQPLEALNVFHQMRLSNVKPNSVTLISLLSACIRLGSLRMGKSVHSYITVNKVELDVVLGTALVDMYIKCGHVEKALQIFSSINQKNLQCWTVMISGCADHGRGKDALSLFHKMENNGLKPDSVAFSGILCACSHLGLVNEGQHYFDKMINVYAIQPTMEHYGCMVDLFGRAGLLEAAYQFIQDMSLAPNSVILRSFMAACRNHGKVLHADDKLMSLLLKIEPDLGANYVLAANVSVLSGGWDDAAHLRSSLAEKGLNKVPGYSWMEMNGGNIAPLTLTEKCANWGK